MWIAGPLLVLLAVLLLVLALAGGGALPRGRIGRMARIGRLSARLSTSWLGARLRRRFASPAKRQRIDEARRRADAVHVAATMGQMKGAFMKLGQMLSFVNDEVPAEMRQALSALQSAAPPMDFAQVRDAAERELGRPLERAFARFDETPLAAASIGQVHRAALPDGTEVAVKVQYPGAADAIRGDLDNATLLYSLLRPFYPGVDHAAVVDELRARIGEELDYVAEARNQSEFAALYDGHPFIHVPRVVASHSSARLLTSELARGRRFADVLALDQAARDGYGEVIYRFVFASLVRHGLFNGDPHPGNYLFGDDGRVTFLDFGCVKRFPADTLDNWRGQVRAHLGGDRAGFERRLVALGFLAADSGFDRDLLFDYFKYVYEPIEAAGPYTFTTEYNRRALKTILKPEGRFAVVGKRLNMPRDFVFMNRIHWGVYSILGQLGATAVWHDIYREFLDGAAPATERGRREADWRAARAPRSSTG